MNQNENFPRKYLNVSYDSQSPAQKFDLFLPEKGDGPFPLIFFIHGGGWFTGDKADGQETGFRRLLADGYALASINYRLSGEAPHPAGIIDCKTALRFIKAHAEEYHINPDAIAVAGDSSGGQYALLVALTPGDSQFDDLSRGYADQNEKVQAAVIWYPATDLAETMRTVQDGEYTGYGAQFAWDNISRYLGKTITDVNDPLLKEASPVSYVNKDMPPVLLQHGDADTIAPIDQSRRMYQAIVKGAGADKVEFDILPGASHGDPAFETAENMERVHAFLSEHGIR